MLYTGYFRKYKLKREVLQIYFCLNNEIMNIIQKKELHEKKSTLQKTG